MEAIAALSLAYNVVQLVELGLKIVSECRQIYEHGSTIKDRDFASTTRNMSAVCGDLNKALLKRQTLQPLTREDTELLDMAKQCQVLAVELQKELRKADQYSPGSFKAALRYTSSILRRALTEAQWSFIFKDDQNVLEIEDCFEAVMLYQSSEWRRINHLGRSQVRNRSD